jgi:ABC-type bacteriocin/lantibiotic exporter with double-glycine peptidase domain
MSIELPLYAQKKRNTCALACLRMVLAAFGTKVAENVLESQARMVEDGMPIEELERLARQFNLAAEIRETTVGELASLRADGRLAIAYIDRAVFGLDPRRRRSYFPRNPKIHTVIPTHVTTTYVTFHDPLPPRITRRTIEVFQRAHQILGGYCVVCSKAEES